MSYNGIGLSSAKGSSTSGHIQKSRHQRKTGRHGGRLYEKRKSNKEMNVANVQVKKKNAMQMDKLLVDHEKARVMEVLVAEHRDYLEDKYPEKDDAEIEVLVKEFRAKLIKDSVEKEKVVEEEIVEVNRGTE